jgi:pyruvate dehydrogenase E1 component alpha subunit
MKSADKPKSLFSAFDPLTSKMFQVMDNQGKIINRRWQPEISDGDILKAYKFMQFVRTADLMAVSFQRQGRMYTYPPNFGQEAISTATGFVMKKGDWLVPAFREMAAYLRKGASLKDFFLIWGGNEDGLAFPEAPRLLPLSVPIASQLLHAVGIGYAIKYRKEKDIVFAFVGDGGTSHGDFHEALNFAGVWKVPVVFIVQNNQYAISVPVKKQTSSQSIAIKSVAYGIKGIKVDGNDYLALNKTLSEASNYARSGQGPILIEAVTFRRGAHTTSDDPTLYREEKEEKEWAKRDPIKRLRSYLIAKKKWSEEADEPLLNQYKKEVEDQFFQYENYTPYSLSDVFTYHYQDMPEDLRKQQVEFEKYLNWKEAQK